MPIPQDLMTAVDAELSAFCARRVPEAVRHQVRLVHAWDGNKVTLVEQRPRWNNPSEWIDHPIARFRYRVAEGDWTIDWRDAHGKWHDYKPHPGSKAFSRVLAEVDQDPTGIFWG